ncbi:MAG: hypothetical protein ABIK68_06295 [bacterium]
MDREQSDINRVKLAEGAEAVGLALMLQDLISQNLEQNPHKLKDLKKLNMSFGLTVTDADVRMTMEFADGVLTLHPGIKEQAGVLIESETDIVMAMSNLRIKGGMPYYFDETGRDVLKAIFSGRMKVIGMLAHFPSMIRLSRLLSVH